MIIQFVKLKTGLSDSDLQRVMKERMPEFRAVPGLIQKYYGYEKATGEYAGIYLWESEAHLAEFRKSELAKTIPVAYETQGPPRIEIFDILTPLRDE